MKAINVDTLEWFQVTFGADKQKAILILKPHINDLDIIDAEPVRHGKWVKEHKPNSKNNGRFYCSECLGYLPFNRREPKTNYCTNCGAKMDLKE